MELPSSIRKTVKSKKEVFLNLSKSFDNEIDLETVLRAVKVSCFDIVRINCLIDEIIDLAGFA
jgi:hypothetical protein